MAQDPYKYFRPEAREIVDRFSQDVLDLEKGEGGAATVQRLLRLAHTLKGAARVVKQTEIAKRAHAIEDTLSPLRDLADQIGRQQIDTVLEHLDAINGHLATLAPALDPKAPAAARSDLGDIVRTIRLDVAEADAVLDGVAETHALVGILRTATQSLERATGLADQLLSQFAPFSVNEHDRRSGGGSDRRFVLAEELRRAVSGIGGSVSSAVDQMDRELRQLRETAERLRLVPAAGLFTTLERVARDTAHASGKQVTFEGIDGDIRLDAHVLETLQGALVQIIRNAVAHGIEPESERTRAGKPAAGRVSVAVARRGRRIVFSCSDDGRGVDLDGVRRVARQRGLAGPATKEIGPDELGRLLLQGGISTSNMVTEVSGRGIGLDVVREAVERLAGKVGFQSIPGAGTTFELVIPPSLASMDALIVEAGGLGCTMAIPLDTVRGARRINAGEISVATFGASILHDGEAIAFTPLSAALDNTLWSVERTWAAVIVGGVDGMAAIGVERLLGTAKIVVRPLPQRMTTSPIVVAASLDADGNPQLVVDTDSLVAAARRGRPAELDAPPRLPVLIVDDSLTTRMLEQGILESAGYDVDAAASGEEGLELLRERRYALILVDVEMPGMDGFSFIERLRSDPQARDIPAILVSSLAGPAHRQRGRAVGAQGYIDKGEFDQAALLSMIKPLVV